MANARVLHGEHEQLPSTMPSIRNNSLRAANKCGMTVIWCGPSGFPLSRARLEEAKRMARVAGHMVEVTGHMVEVTGHMAGQPSGAKQEGGKTARAKQTAHFWRALTHRQLVCYHGCQCRQLVHATLRPFRGEGRGEKNQSHSKSVECERCGQSRAPYTATSRKKECEKCDTLCDIHTLIYLN